MLVAGCGESGSRDGPADRASFMEVAGLAADGGSVWFLDRRCSRVGYICSLQGWLSYSKRMDEMMAACGLYNDRQLKHFERYNEFRLHHDSMNFDERAKVLST